ncbi:hypothetical protein ACT7DJ_10275 [Bacillus cereus]
MTILFHGLVEVKMVSFVGTYKLDHLQLKDTDRYIDRVVLTFKKGDSD